MKRKIIIGAIVTTAFAAIIIGVSFASAQTATLQTNCVASVSNNTITWTAPTSGGVAPYTYLWSGDASVAGSTSTSITGTYGANGTYSASVKVTDASSSVATGSCYGVITSIVTPPPLQASCTASVFNNTIVWTASSSGGVAPYTYLWSGDASVAGSTSTSITATYGANGTYSASVRATDASSTIANGSCYGTVTYFGTSASTTPPTHTSVNLPPELQIGPNGNFLARDLIVQSVSGNLFTATIWGITYTVNVASSTNGGARPEFYLRGGGSGGAFDVSQLQTGDQLGVSGLVSAGSPLVVNATVIRDYSITVRRTNMPPHGNMNGSFGGNENNGNHYGNENGNGNSTSGPNGPNTNDFTNRLNQLFQQMQNLQNLFKNRFGR